MAVIESKTTDQGRVSDTGDKPLSYLNETMVWRERGRYKRREIRKTSAVRTNDFFLGA